MTDPFWEGIAERVVGAIESLTASHGVARQLTVDDSLVDNGFSSLAMVDLMLAVECAFDLTIPEQELLPKNFMSIRTLVDMLVRLFPVRHQAVIA